MASSSRSEKRCLYEILDVSKESTPEEIRIRSSYRRMVDGFVGLVELAKDFVVSGTASESLYGACEAMYKPDMGAEELFETISQALLSSVDRDCLSGWGGHVYVVTPTEIKERILKGRMD